MPRSRNTPGRPIRSAEDLVADEEAQANDLPDRAPYQARPLIELRGSHKRKGRGTWPATH